MDNTFTIHYATYLRLCQWKQMHKMPADYLLLGILCDLHPVDEKGWYKYGVVEISIEDLWKRRMMKVPANLAGTTIKIIYDYDQNVRAAELY